ncbi:MAG: FAD-binding oxidoreductase [Anaerolineae bacterium]|nr:FAD-binding oxidoreductase [Anaerolineae bacterium]
MYTQPLSHWHTSFSTHAHTSRDLPKTADVVVIGGGIVGTCATYWLARNGASPKTARVVQLEQNAFANGATGRNGGFVTLGTAESYSNSIKRNSKANTDAIWQLTVENRELMRQVLREEQLDCDYREPGALSLALSDEVFAEMARDTEARNANGFEGVMLDRHQLRTLVRTELGDPIRGAGFKPNTALLHSAKFVNALARAAQQHGAIACTAEALGFEVNGDSIQVQTSIGAIVTKGVVMGANAWTSRFLPELKDKVWPVRGQVLSYAPIPPVFAPGMGASVTPTGEYWQQTPTGEIVIGGCRAARPDGDVGLINNDTTDDVQTALERVLPTLFPKLEGLKVSQRWSGPMAFTPDYVPIADCIPNLPNAWFAGGFCGHGMPFGMIFGKLLAQAAMNSTKPEALTPFAMNRATLR